MNGHVNREHQRFCGECGVPVLAHLSRKPATADGRWHVDPTPRHQYRYWDGRTWRRHVVGNGAFSTESRIKTTPRSTEARRTMRIAAATMTIVSVILVVAASSTLQSIRKAEPPASRKTDPQLSPVNPISQATAAEPRAGAESPTRGVAVIGATCLLHSSNGMTSDGSVAYCERVRDAERYMWSMSEGDITFARAGDGETGDRADAAVAVRMQQTGRSTSDCVGYRQRPSDPGDGGQ